MATAEKTVTRSEDILGEKWDKCVVDAGIKLSTGIVVGKNHTKFIVIFGHISFLWTIRNKYMVSKRKSNVILNKVTMMLRNKKIRTKTPAQIGYYNLLKMF